MKIIQKTRLKEVDGLRAFCVLLVVIGHWIRHIFPSNSLTYKLWAHAASTGVFIFFVMSGYIITRLFLEEKRINGRISILNFYLRRLFRIVPAFYAYLIIIFLLSRFEIIHVTREELISAGLFFSNFSFFHLGWFVSHSWSLATEEQFYIIFPIIFCLGINFMQEKAFIILGLLLYLSWGVFSAMHWTDVAGLFFHLNWIISGVILSMYENYFNDFTSRYKFVVVVLMVLYFFLAAGVFNFPHQGIVYIPCSCFLICWLLIRSIHSSGLWAKCLLHPVIQWVGLSSYSMYLWQQLFTYHASFIWTPIGILFFTLVSYNLIEKPFNRIGRLFITNYQPVKMNEREKIVASIDLEKAFHS